MTAPASSARGPSDSPVTASVVKFRCLFTHDLRRKSKRWQDGYLRYHAFNKRVMVYDEQGNFIGDHHWRSGDEVQDGDELELDKGVLIEVGERMSTTQTDLTNLFEKRKSSQGSPSSNTHLSQAARTSTPVRSSGSSQPFRSLNDLLGIRKAPVGHLMSPYEERHHLSSSNTNTALSSGPDRPLKRQKVVVPQPTAINKKKSVSEVVDLTEPERIPSNSNQSRVGLVQEVRRPQESMPSMPPPEKPRKETVPKPHIPNKPGVAKSSSSLPSKPPADVPTKVPDRAPAKDPPSAKPAKGSPPSHHVQEIQDDDWEAPIKNMRVTMQKPRKKLMYSALLPGEKPQKPSPPPRISRAEKTNQPAPKAAATE
ncbi:hypothetical protein N7492_000214 [Penicillium capsulatum]|uniref:5'-3' DNA helicase ZGRF1-like N-terminal domain-containing protein n=1 Tax=Penicillium capsulatum TaxID=69766 RepID=A0A9W9IQT9_9EURO|nr:hypothetical protein N7492_000214 [Penicillium capsulatum]KAJ6130721.1 hypothetical protein N7512_003501 [Penicillium capsulatum]